MNKSTLYILRGVSGCGKTTLAKALCELPNTVAVAADDYHYDEYGNYNFRFENLKAAHQWSQKAVAGYMGWGRDIVVHNTNTTDKEIQPYLELAEKRGYRVVSLVVENRHGNSDVHDVPEEVKDKQEQRIKNSLKLR